jgi:hypothetical protein
MTRDAELAAQTAFIRGHGVFRCPPRKAALSSSRRQRQDDRTLAGKPPRFHTKRKRK